MKSSTFLPRLISLALAILPDYEFKEIVTHDPHERRLIWIRPDEELEIVIRRRP